MLPGSFIFSTNKTPSENMSHISNLLLLSMLELVEKFKFFAVSCKVGRRVVVECYVKRVIAAR